jgi:CxxC motif-containing protein
LRNDKEVVLVAVKKYGLPLEFVSAELKNDKEIVLSAVSNCGSALNYASVELKNDKEVVLAAVSNHGWALKYASDELKNNKEVVLAALSNRGIALNYVSLKLRTDYTTMKELFMLAMKTFYNSTEYTVYKYDDEILYDCVLSEKFKEELDYINRIYNCVSYKPVCEYIKRTDEIKKFSYRIPMLDTKFRFI